MHTPDDELFYHDHGDGIVHCHEHPPEETDMAGHIEHEHAHCEHGHVHTQSKAVVNRLSRAIGHLESVKRMFVPPVSFLYRSLSSRCLFFLLISCIL